MEERTVRRAWQVGEPVHALTYFAPETRAATAALGVPGGWMSYFGCRAAPLGAVSAAAATAVFYNLAPSMVARSIPDVWRYAAPEALLAARTAAMDQALHRVMGDEVAGDRLRRAAELAVEAAAVVGACGRPLAAANAALPLPDAPHLALWQALTTLREYRGDGHIAVLLTWGVDPCAANVLAAASGRVPADNLKYHHKWTDAEWDVATKELAARGWLADDGGLTAAGADAREQIERATDRLASEPYRALGQERTERLIACLRPLADTVIAAGAVLVPNPAGLPWPPDKSS